jgi:hypothetical protein
MRWFTNAQFTDGHGQSSGRPVRQLPSLRFFSRYNGNHYVELHG